MQDKQHGNEDAYEQLMAISKEALVNAHYETAYHTLTAAMHYATDFGNEQRLAEVERVANEQQDWIDSHAPEHRMSSQSTIKRHGTNLYNMLARQAAAQILIVKQKHRRDDSKRMPWLGDASQEIH